VMVKCSKNHCYKMTDKYVRDVHTFNNNGMFVFGDYRDQDQALMDDRALNDLISVSEKPLTLNHCMKGECEKTFGYIRYNGGNSVAIYSPSEKHIITDKFVLCTGTSGAGKVKSNMDLCVSNDGSGKTSTITGIGVLYSNKLYQRTGENVIGTAWSGNYVYIDENKNKIVKCTNGNCNIIAIEGYKINADHNTNIENPLIYCTANDNCSVKPKKANGYYLFKESGTYGTEYVVCGNSGCYEKETATSLGSTCTPSEKYQLIYDNVQQLYKYCDGSTLNEITKLKYYEVEDKFLSGKYFNYPNEFIDEQAPPRKILIKTQPYSVTPVTGENIPIGYIKVGTGYIECKYDTEGSKECKPATLSKTACEVVGELFKTEEKTNLCIDPKNNVSVDLTTDTSAPTGIDSEGQYVISVAGGLFGIGNWNGNRSYYVIVEVDSLGNVTLAGKGNLNFI